VTLLCFFFPSGTCDFTRNLDNVVGITTGYGLDDRGIGVTFSCRADPALGSTQPPIQWVPGALSPGVKRPGREADHTLPTSAEVKKTWVYTSTLPYLMYNLISVH
jgi:hypothetical protein